MLRAPAPEAPIFLIGFMGSGKTTVGGLLADRLGWSFADLDDLIARAAGLTVAEIFSREGEEGFRRRETEAVRAAAAGRRSVVATGGGAACREENLALMLSSGRVVALAVSAAEAVRRTGSRSGRPLLDDSADPLAAATALLSTRQPFYARAHLRVETEGRTPGEAALAIVAALEARGERVSITVPVELGARRYEVRIGSFAPEEIADSLAAAFGASTTGVALLVDGGLADDARTAALCAALDAKLPGVARFDLYPGEACKSLGEIEKTAEWLVRRGYDRKAAIVGIGGGATTDHAGFAAAIYLRGIPFASIPTTLLAMVDASVGGKTGVDLPSGKNLIGAFHQPKAVIAELGFLDTLPARERAAGLAEVVKCGFIADPTILDLVEESGPVLSPELVRELVTRAVRVKAEVVAEDETESGRRAILNFGHTVGHALEAASGYDLLHGEAVSLGIVAALELGARLGVGSPALTERARRLLSRLSLPVDLARRLNADVWARITVDKKRRGSTIRFVLCPKPGETLLRHLTPKEIAAALGTPEA